MHRSILLRIKVLYKYSVRNSLFLREKNIFFFYKTDYATIKVTSKVTTKEKMQLSKMEKAMVHMKILPVEQGQRQVQLFLQVHQISAPTEKSTRNTCSNVYQALLH